MFSLKSNFLFVNLQRSRVSVQSLQRLSSRRARGAWARRRLGWGRNPGGSRRWLELQKLSWNVWCRDREATTSSHSILCPKKKRTRIHLEGSTKEEAAGRQWRRLQSRICRLRWLLLKNKIHPCELYREQTWQLCYVVGWRLFPCIHDPSSVHLISDRRPFWNLSEVFPWRGI